MSGRLKIAVLMVACWCVGTSVLFGQLRGGACCGVSHVAGESQEAGDVTPPVSQPDDIARLQLPDVRITSVTHRSELAVVGIGPESPPMDAPHLEVHGLIGGTIGFELLLPDRWNRRIVMGGGGGLVGSFVYAGKDAVTHGYAVVGTDTGHQAPTGLTADWALYDLEAQINFGYPQRVVYRGAGSVQDESSFISDHETATVGTCEMSKRTYVYKQVGDCPIKADVYRLPGDEPRPALVWIHGGALIMGDRGLIGLGVFNDYLRRFLEAGFVVISIDYRLAPETKLPQIMEDLQDAFRWVRETGPEAFQVDPQRVAVTGGSAGGYLTLMAGCCVEPRPQCLVSCYGYGDIVGEWYAKPDEFYLKEPAVPREEAYASVGTIPLSGCAFSTEEGVKRGRFYLYCRQNGRWCHEVAGLDPIKDLEALLPFCPVRNVTNEYPPTMLLHGDQDTDVPHAQSIMMAKELARHGVAHELRILSGQGHGFEFVLQDNEWKKNDDPQVTAATEAVLLFLKKHVEK